MEGSASDWRYGIVASEGVDAAAIRKSRIRKNRLRNQHAATHSIEHACMQTNLSARVAEDDGITIPYR
jgi:hypothetical protein